MGKNIEFIRIPGTAPRVIRRDSLFDDLLGEGKELSDWAEEDFYELKRILESGGINVDIKLKHSLTTGTSPSSPQQWNEERRGKTELFNVLALDLATIFPAVPGRRVTMGTYTGQQVCICKAPEGSDKDNNWYRSALKDYFQTGIGGSLLSFPEIQKNYRTWWVLRRRPASTQSDLAEDQVQRPPLKQNFTWKEEFDPKKKIIERESSSDLFKKRFNEYGVAVFDKLEQVQTPEDTSSTLIVWVYVGPSEHSVPQTSRYGSSWGVSLFAVIKPANYVQPHEGHWLDDPRLRAGLLRAVNQLYLLLAAAAYKTLEYRRLMDKALDLLQSAGFVFGHDLKNRLEELKHEEVRFQLRGLKQQLKELVEQPEDSDGRQKTPPESKLNEIKRSLKALPVDVLDSADACLGKLATFSATPELFRVMGKFVSGELPYEWARKELADEWPEGFMPSEHLAKAAEACDTVVRQVVSSYVKGLDFELRKIEDGKLVSVQPIDRVEQARIELPPLSHTPSIAPPYAILAGLSELVRNAVKAVTGSARRADILHKYGKLHLDYSISIDEREGLVRVSIWNPYSGQAPPMSETIGYMVRMYEQLGAVEIEPVHTGSPHPLIKGLGYGQSDFIFRPQKIRFAKKG
jgi:hypothetical protein